MFSVNYTRSSIFMGIIFYFNKFTWVDYLITYLVTKKQFSTKKNTHLLSEKYRILCVTRNILKGGIEQIG